MKCFEKQTQILNKRKPPHNQSQIKEIEAKTNQLGEEYKVKLTRLNNQEGFENDYSLEIEGRKEDILSIPPSICQSDAKNLLSYCLNQYVSSIEDKMKHTRDEISVDYSRGRKYLETVHFSTPSSVWFIERNKWKETSQENTDAYPVWNNHGFSTVLELERSETNAEPIEFAREIVKKLETNKESEGTKIV